MNKNKISFIDNVLAGLITPKKERLWIELKNDVLTIIKPEGVAIVQLKRIESNNSYFFNSFKDTLKAILLKKGVALDMVINSGFNLTQFNDGKITINMDDEHFKTNTPKIDEMVKRVEQSSEGLKMLDVAMITKNGVMRVLKPINQNAINNVDINFNKYSFIDNVFFNGLVAGDINNNHKISCAIKTSSIKSTEAHCITSPVQFKDGNGYYMVILAPRLIEVNFSEVRQ